MTTTTVPETMTRQATVAEASQVEGRNGATQWSLKLEIKDISQFPVPCFMSLELAPKVLKGSTHLVTMRRGKLKQKKGGTYPSDFFWDLTHWDVQAPAPQAPAAQLPSATEKPQQTAPSTPVPWDAADTQSRISWAQAINLAVAVLDTKLQSVSVNVPTPYLSKVERLANYFYPLIRKGPSSQEDDIDPETLPWDAPQSPQEATDGVSAPAAEAQAAIVKLPPRFHDEVDYTYFFRAARAVVGLSPTQALAKLGIGNWNQWVGAGHTLQEALEKLAPAKAG